MKKVIPLKSFVTREEVLQNIKDNHGSCYFHLECDWDMADYDHLNSLLDEDVDNGTYFNGVSYDPIKLDNGSLIFEVCVEDCEDYIKVCKEEE